MVREGSSQGELGSRGGWAPGGHWPGSRGRGTELPGSGVEVLGRANHLNGRRLLRDRLYSLIEFALKCNLIFSEAVSSPSSPPPETGHTLFSVWASAFHSLALLAQRPPHSVCTAAPTHPPTPPTATWGLHSGAEVREVQKILGLS